MLNLIKKIIGGEKATLQKVSDDIKDAHVPLCALLLETAHSDGECSTEEMDNIINTLTDHFGIAKGDLENLIATGYKERDEAVDIFRFTRYMNNNYSKEEKISVMEAVWRVILTDGRLEAHEDHLAHKLANLLRLTHQELIQAKTSARKQLLDNTYQPKA